MCGGFTAGDGLNGGMVVSERTHAGMLRREELVRTSALDQSEWNYDGVLGWISRRRLVLAEGLLGGPRYERLVEVGYGSGVFMPAWAAHATAVAGIDVHAHAEAVQTVLARRGIVADLREGSVTLMPFQDGEFDALVAVSSLEFVDDLDAACREIRRVLRPGGVCCAVTPGHSRVLDAGLRFLTGERAEDTFQGRRQRIIPTLLSHFELVRRVDFPPGAPELARLYSGLLLR